MVRKEQHDMPWGDAVVIKRNGDFIKDGVKIGTVVGLVYDEVLYFGRSKPTEAQIKLEIQLEFD